MNIELTKKQYECLVKILAAADFVYGILGDTVSAGYKKQSNEIEALRSYFLEHAHDFDMEHMTEKFMGKIILNEQYDEKFDEAMDDYNNETFWHELETRLGKRDFARTETQAEKIEIEENNGWYPDRIHEIYAKWSKEFEDNGIENLGIVGK